MLCNSATISPPDYFNTCLSAAVFRPFVRTVL
nr:MAG TPA: hypothetical protein [Caudoviricetes sp.]